MFVYIIAAAEFRKIGTTKNPAIRLRDMQPSNPFPLVLDYVLEAGSEDAFVIESEAKWLLDTKRTVGEWFRASKEEAVAAVVTGAKIAARTRQRKRQRAATIAGIASGRVRQEVIEPMLAIARPMWRDRAYTVEQIITQSGLSRRTLYNEFGPRWQNDSGVPHV